MARKRRLSGPELTESLTLTKLAGSLVEVLIARHPENAELGFVGQALKRLEREIVDTIVPEVPPTEERPAPHSRDAPQAE